MRTRVQDMHRVVWILPPPTDLTSMRRLRRARANAEREDRLLPVRCRSERKLARLGNRDT